MYSFHIYIEYVPLIEMVNYEFLICSGKCMYNVLIVVDIYCDVRGIRGLYIRGLHVSGLGRRPWVDYGGRHHFGHPHHHAVPSQQRRRSHLLLGRKSNPYFSTVWSFGVFFYNHFAAGEGARGS